eukprot:12980741-Heterocapsa_arctica.AAC.1
MTFHGKELANHVYNLMVSDVKMHDTVDNILEVRRDAGERGDEHRRAMSTDVGEAKLIQS